MFVSVTSQIAFNSLEGLKKKSDVGNCDAHMAYQHWAEQQ